jgi:hypothetical protein
MRRGTIAGVSERQASRFCTCLRDHFGQSVERRIRFHQQDIGGGSQQRYRREILEGVVWKFRIKKWIGGVTAGDNNERISVGCRGRERLGCYDAARAGTVFNDDPLTPLPSNDIAKRARQNIDAAARRIWHENMYGPGRERRLGTRHIGRDEHRSR